MLQNDDPRQEKPVNKTCCLSLRQITLTTRNHWIPLYYSLTSFAFFDFHFVDVGQPF
jgi:hypothetical protein